MFDGTKYNHAAIFDGKNVIEAVGTGVETHSLRKATMDAEFVGVCRLKKGGKFLGESKLPYLPVGKTIARFQKERDRYAYEQILLLAVLALTRRVPILMLRWILDHAASVIAKITSGGREPMICSELVYRCFLGAGDLYSPEILGAALLNKELSLMGNYENDLMVNGDDPEARRLKIEFLELYQSSKERAASEFEVQAGNPRKPNPNFVTPGDLYKSPNLQFLGYLSL